MDFYIGAISSTFPPNKFKGGEACGSIHSTLLPLVKLKLFKCAWCKDREAKRREREYLERQRIYEDLLKDYQDYVQFYAIPDEMSLMHSVRDKDDFDNQLKEAGTKLVVVDFYATWCGPCKMISPKLEEMAQQFTDVIFLKVDVDDNEEVASQYGISCMPTFMFFKKGEKVAEFSGANADKVKELVVSNK